MCLSLSNWPYLEYNHFIFSWTGECIWGICSDSFKLNSLDSASTRCNCVYLSSSEEESVKEQMKKRGFAIKEASGAGNKILQVIKNQGDCYVLSKSTTFKWDTCGPQAILRSLGGDIVSYTEMVQKKIVKVKYPHDIDGKKSACNEGGLIAYRIPEILNDFMEDVWQ